MPARTEPRPPEDTFPDSQDHARSFRGLIPLSTHLAAAVCGSRTRTGNGGRARGFGGGFLSSSARMTSMARSSWGSLPAATRAGSCSTSMSGGTPTFSTTQPSSVKIAEVGGRHDAAIHEHREPQDADQSAPRPLADQLTHAEFAEHPRQQVAAGACCFVDDHHLGAQDGRVLACGSFRRAGWPSS